MAYTWETIRGFTWVVAANREDLNKRGEMEKRISYEDGSSRDWAWTTRPFALAVSCRRRKPEMRTGTSETKPRLYWLRSSSWMAWKICSMCRVLDTSKQRPPVSRAIRMRTPLPSGPPPPNGPRMVTYALASENTME